ncbi:hypothetical protein F0919_15025 [Taibaiella lutea]|uniref:Glycosyltransferase RgtA/B/C/D-like domain-containing protein n=1 Tax=Taibaiella lutea TaxID=2608001 RepID=A0A5M6CE30_9BACT|nr:hypothetical protein [Taibaiella lutea]KAA5532112.1 hypothetical protein F0919_15025 [Taibaiella lutea]
MRLNSTQKFLLFFIPYFILYCISSHNALFWDTVQFAGDHPNWYFSTNFQYPLLPNSCDSGHPPTFGFLIASGWKIFGRGLFQSHTFMLPFIVLIVWQAVRTGDLLFSENKKASFALSLLILTQSILLTQCTLVSPDIWLAGFFLFTFNGILKQNKLQLIIGVIALGLISNRAMMAAFTLYLFALGFGYTPSVKGIKQWISYAFSKVLPFLPGAIIAIAYFSYHYLVKGWVGAPKDSPWAAGFEFVAPQRMVLNVLILGWRIVDLGNLATVSAFVVVCFLWWKNKIVFQQSRQKNIAVALLVLILALFWITAFPLALYQGLLAHRYLLPLNTSIVIFTAYLLFHSKINRKNTWITLLVLVQLSGHFWNYPQRVSQGWEGRLAYLNFFPLQKDFKDFMLKNGIKKEEVATTGNMTASDYRTQMTNDTAGYKDFEVDSGKYIWYCNVANAMNKAVPYYFEHLQILKREKRGDVEMVLFKRPEEE